MSEQKIEVGGFTYWKEDDGVWRFYQENPQSRYAVSVMSPPLLDHITALRKENQEREEANAVLLEESRSLNQQLFEAESELTALRKERGEAVALLREVYRLISDNPDPNVQEAEDILHSVLIEKLAALSEGGEE